MTLLESLTHHTSLCDEIYRLMLDLNRSFKAGASTPEVALLERQGSALAILDRSLAQLRAHSGARTHSSSDVRAAMEKCQRTILKALLLDRENEQLLLKNAMVRPPAPVAAKPSAGHLARVYGRHR